MLFYVQALLRELQDSGDIKSHSYSFSPSSQQLKLYWVSRKGDDGTRKSGDSTGHHGNCSGGDETPVGVASTGSDGVMSRPEQHLLEEERRLKAEVASLKEKLHKLTTLKLNENKVSAPRLVICYLMYVQSISEWKAKMANGPTIKWRGVTISFQLAITSHLLSSTVIGYDVTPFAICLLDSHSEIGCNVLFVERLLFFLTVAFVVVEG